MALENLKLVLDIARGKNNSPGSQILEIQDNHSKSPAEPVDTSWMIPSSLQENFILSQNRTKNGFRKTSIGIDIDIDIEGEENTVKEEEVRRKPLGDLHDLLRFNLWALKLIEVLHLVPLKVNLTTGRMTYTGNTSRPKIYMCLWTLFYFSRSVLLAISLALDLANIMGDKNVAMDILGGDSDGGSSSVTSKNAAMDVLSGGGGVSSSLTSKLPRFLLQGYVTYVGVSILYGYTQIAYGDFLSYVMIYNSLLDYKDAKDLENVDEAKTMKKKKKLTAKESQLSQLPFGVYFIVVIFPILMIVDKEVAFLISYLPPMEKFELSFLLLQYILFIFIDMTFAVFFSSCEYFAIFFFFFFIDQLLRNSKDAIESMGREEDVADYRIIWGSRRLRLFKFQLCLFNLSCNKVVYLAKHIITVATIIGGYGTIILVQRGSYVYAFVFAFLFVESAGAFNLIFDDAFHIPGSLETLKRDISKLSLQFKSKFVRNHYRRVVKSVQALGISAGGIYYLERASTLIYLGYVTEQIVSLLIALD